MKPTSRNTYMYVDTYIYVLYTVQELNSTYGILREFQFSINWLGG